jgi:hypothetical protein
MLMMQREVKKMPAYEVRPDGTWKNAIECTVTDVVNDKTYKNVPIVRKFPDSDLDTFSIRWRKLPILILNEMNPGDTNDSAPISEDAQYLIIKPIDDDENPINVEVIKNTGWPNGTLLIPK